MRLRSRFAGTKKHTWLTARQIALSTMLIASSFTPLITTVWGADTAYAADHLVAQWKFDETTAGDHAEDYIGNNDGIPGTQTSVYPTPSTDVAPVNFTNPRSAGFNGQNYYTINNPVSTNFTICAWVKTSSTGGGVNHWTSAPIMDAEWGGVNYDFGFGVGNGGKLMFGNGGNPVGGGGLYDQQINGSTTINDNQWHNVCVTRSNTTGAVKLYVDAQLDGQGTTGVGALNVRSVARIGWGYDGAALFQGLIDDVRVYDIDLAPEQLQALTNGVDNPFDDNDGASAEVENAAPGGDGNADGIQDSEQTNVTSFVNSLTNNYVTLAAPTQCQLSGVNTTAATTLQSDNNYTYPLGLLNFTAHCGTPGYSMIVQQIYYNPPGGEFVLRKYASGSYQTITDATITRTTLNGQDAVVAQYTVVDGGPLDEDGVQNGVIVDPAGLAIARGVNTTLKAPNTGFVAHSKNSMSIDASAVCLVAVLASGGLMTLGLTTKRRRARRQ